MTDTDDTHSDPDDDAASTETSPDTADEPCLNQFCTTPETSFADIPGLDDEQRRLERTIIASMKADHDTPANTVLLYGHSHSGATRLAEALTNALADHGFTPYRISLDEHRRRHGGPRALAEYLDQARTVAPCVLHVDGLEHVRLDVGAPARDAIEQLKTASPQVALVSVAVLPEHPRRTVSIDDVIESQWPDVRLRIDRPDTERRRAILADALQRHCDDHGLQVDAAALDLETAVEDLAATDGVVLKTVAKRAAIRAATATGVGELQAEHIQTAATNVADEWDCSSTDSESTGRRRDDTSVEELVSATVPEVSFDDVGGLQDVKQRLQELLVYPEEYAEVFDRADVGRTHGMVLYGPPGTGKTLLAKGVANATDRSFMAVQGPELKNKWFGETERRIREVIARADEHAPSVVFFDEFDAIAGSRDGFTHEANSSIVATLLAELDGLEDRDDVLFLAATNRPAALDDAILRGGRFGETVAVPLPDQEGRREIFEIHAADLPTDPAVTSAWFAERAPEGLSGADIATICKQALYEALRDAEPAENETVTIDCSHVQAAIDVVTDDGERADPRAFA